MGGAFFRDEVLPLMHHRRLPLQSQRPRRRVLENDTNLSYPRCPGHIRKFKPSGSAFDGPDRNAVNQFLDV
jgi:hypothetical protein